MFPPLTHFLPLVLVLLLVLEIRRIEAENEGRRTKCLGFLRSLSPF